MATPEEYTLIEQNKKEMEKISKRLKNMTEKIHGEPPTEPVKEKKAK
jgi:hypothetical protein